MTFDQFLHTRSNERSELAKRVGSRAKSKCKSAGRAGNHGQRRSDNLEQHWQELL